LHVKLASVYHFGDRHDSTVGQDDLGQGIKLEDKLLNLADLFLIYQVCLVEHNHICKLKLIDQELAQRDLGLLLHSSLAHSLDNELNRGQISVEAKTVDHCDHRVQTRHTLQTETFLVLESKRHSHG
jgi:hypothetical protein